MTQFIQDAVNALSLGSLYALFSLSVAVIFGVARVVNFANGELMTLPGYAMIATAALPWPIVILVAIGVAVASGLLMDAVVFRWTRGAHPTTLLIVSFGVSYLIQNALLIGEGSQPKTLNFGSSLIKSVSIGSIQVGILSLISIGATIVLIIGLVWLLRSTTVGRQLRAASEDFSMARLLGVPANRVIAYAFAISGALAGIAGILLTINTAILTPDFGVRPVIVAFVAVVIGGIGSLTGAAIGGLAVGVVTIVLQVTLPDNLRPYRDAFVFALVIVSLLVRPQGLLPPAYAKERV